MRNWLKDKYVVLSGVSGGIGKELCKLLICRYGARVIGIARSEEKIKRLQEELGDKAEWLQYHLFDVSERQNWLTLANTLKEQGIHPNLLINNAGAFPTFSRTLETDVQTVERIIKTNYLSTVYAISALSPLLLGDKKDKRAIVNVCSSSALCAVVGTAAYSASKAAIKGYTEALQMEEKGRTYVGILYPGTTQTELFRDDENTQNSALQKIAMPAEKMAKKMAKAILKKKKRAIIGWDAKCMNFMAKLMPVKGLALIAWVMKISKSKVFTEVFKESEQIEVESKNENNME